MLKLFTTLAIVAVPTTAFAHPGHPHAGSELSHHLLEYGGLAVAAFIAFKAVGYFRSRRAEKRDS